MNENEETLAGLAENIGQLLDLQNEDNDRKAAALYRAMFANEKDIKSRLSVIQQTTSAESQQGLEEDQP